MAATPGGGMRTKVYLLDGSYREFSITAETHFSDLRDAMARKLGLPEETAEIFDIFPLIAGYEHQPLSKLREAHDGGEAQKAKFSFVKQLLDVCPAHEANAKKKKLKYAGESRLVYKRWSFNVSAELTVRDPMGVRLLYMQAVHDVINNLPASQTGVNGPVNILGRDGRYLRLAALQLVVNFGGNVPADAVGFLRRGDVLENYIPSVYFKPKVGSPDHTEEEWEQYIISSYNKLTEEERAMSVVDAMLAYLKEARKIKLYGGIFSMPCKVYVGKGEKQSKWQGRVVIVVTPSRFAVVDYTQRMIVNETTFDHLAGWGGEAAHTKMYVDVIMKEGVRKLQSGSASLEQSREHFVRYTFETNQGHHISSCLDIATAQHAEAAAARVQTSFLTSHMSATSMSVGGTLANPLYEPESPRRPQMGGTGGSATATTTTTNTQASGVGVGVGVGVGGGVGVGVDEDDGLADTPAAPADRPFVAPLDPTPVTQAPVTKAEPAMPDDVVSPSQVAVTDNTVPGSPVTPTGGGMIPMLNESSSSFLDSS